LFINNDGDLYRQQHTPINENLALKKAKGVYDHAKAVKLFGYLAESGAKKYDKEFGGGAPLEWARTFSPATRKAVAEELTEDFEGNWENGEYRGTLPKKYQAS